MYNPIKPYKKEILTVIEKTWKTPYITVSRGPYPLIKKHFSYLEVDHTDGLGTKGIYHWQRKTFLAAVIDALAMNLNDLALARAVPYKIQNHLTLPREDSSVLKIIRALARECQKRKIAITGGENSFHDNADSLDLSITMSGFIRHPRPNRFKVGDALIGLASHGLHANGFSKIRRLFPGEFRADFVKPTAIYLEAILEVDRRLTVNGLMHITGGAFTKLKDLLSGADAIITRQYQLRPQKIFQEIFSRGVRDREMYTTFNCGVGFIFSVAPSAVMETLRLLKKHGHRAASIGRIKKGWGRVYIDSFFSNQTIKL